MAQSAGVSRVAAMPDSSHLVERGADDPQLSIAVELLPMPALYNEGDTTRAAAAMEALGVNCLITLGGDGTNRAVAQGSCAIPLIPTALRGGGVTSFSRLCSGNIGSGKQH